jgi:hypothetical protein
MKFDAQIVNVPVTFVRRSGDYPFTTEVVTHRGIFARMSAPPALMAYETMRFVLPPPNEALVLQGVVTRLVRPSTEGGLWGVAIAFYGKGGDAGAAWDQFVDSLEPASREPDPDAAPGSVRLEVAPTIDIPVISPSMQRRAVLGIDSMRPGSVSSTAITVPSRRALSTVAIVHDE